MTEKEVMEQGWPFAFLTFLATIRCTISSGVAKTPWVFAWQRFSCYWVHCAGLKKIKTDQVQFFQTSKLKLIMHSLPLYICKGEGTKLRIFQPLFSIAQWPSTYNLTSYYITNLLLTFTISARIHLFTNYYVTLMCYYIIFFCLPHPGGIQGPSCCSAHCVDVYTPRSYLGATEKYKTFQAETPAHVMEANLFTYSSSPSCNWKSDTDGSCNDVLLSQNQLTFRAMHEPSTPSAVFFLHQSLAREKLPPQAEKRGEICTCCHWQC